MDSKPSGMIANGCSKHFKGMVHSKTNIPLLFSYVKLQKTKQNKHTHTHTKHHKSRMNHSFEPVLFTEIVYLIHKLDCSLNSPQVKSEEKIEWK